MKLSKEVSNVLIQNKSAIFGKIVTQEKYQKALGKAKVIYIPTDEVMKYVFNVTKLSLEQFEESELSYEIILNHIDPNFQKQFKVVYFDGTKDVKTIDNIKAFKAENNSTGLIIYLIKGLLATEKQRISLRNLSGLLDRCPKQNCPNIVCDGQNYDKFGYDIFQIFDLKYIKADKIFERAANKILSLYEQRRLTDNDRAALVNILDLYSEAYTRFVKQIVTDRTYTPKASSGQQPIKIVNAKDWAEAIIEFNDLVNKFGQTLDENIKAKTNTDSLLKECETSDPKKCGYPCTVKKGLIKNSCTYK